MADASAEPLAEEGPTVAAEEGEPDAPPPPPEPIPPEKLQAHLRIAAAFRVFDHENNNTVDVRELGTIVRSLGCVPSEDDLIEMKNECEDEQDQGIIKYERFEPMMTRLLLANRFKSETEDTILRAFEVLDAALNNGEKKGFLTEEGLSNYLTQDGEPYSTEELDEMMSAAKDLDKGVIYYDEHTQYLALEEHAA